MREGTAVVCLLFVYRRRTEGAPHHTGTTRIITVNHSWLEIHNSYGNTFFAHGPPGSKYPTQGANSPIYQRGLHSEQKTLLHVYVLCPDKGIWYFFNKKTSMQAYAVGSSYFDF